MRFEKVEPSRTYTNFPVGLLPPEAKWFEEVRNWPDLAVHWGSDFVSYYSRYNTNGGLDFVFYSNG